jgi:hypothetical protein
MEREIYVTHQEINSDRNVCQYIITVNELLQKKKFNV